MREQLVTERRSEQWLGRKRARLKRWLVIIGWTLYVASQVAPVRAEGGSLVFGAGFLLGLLGTLVLVAQSYTRAEIVAVFVLMCLPNLVVLSTPFTIGRRFGERLLYRLLVASAAVETIVLASTLGQSLPYIRGASWLSVLWAASATFIAAGFLVDPAAVPGWQWPRRRSATIQQPRATPPISASSPPPSTGTFGFDVFLSYSSRADYGLVRVLEPFLETFHETRGLTRELRPLQVCTDLSDFRLPAVQNRREAPSIPPAIAQIISAHLARSEFLLVLCCPEAARSRWVAHEVDWFLDHRDPEHVLLAVTGGDPAGAPERVFPDRILKIGLEQRRSWYDLRRARWRYLVRRSGAKNWDDERVRLAADLSGSGAAGEVRPIWFRDRMRKRALRLLTALSILVLALAVGWKFVELSLRLDAVDYENDGRRLRALHALIRWYDYDPPRIKPLVMRDDGEQLFRLLTAGCQVLDSESVVEQVPRVAGAVDAARMEERGSIRLALNQAARVAPPHQAEKFVEPGGYGQPATVPSIDDELGTPNDWLEVPGRASMAPFRVTERPLVDSNSAPAMMTAAEAFERGRSLGQLPTPGQLERAYALGLPRLEAEWCRYDTGIVANPCEACRMADGRLSPVYPFARGGTAAKAALRVVEDVKK